jgi:hypothetical protein
MSEWLSHLAADLADDAVAGYLFHGYVFSAWMGWPWWTPDEGTVRVAHVFARCLECVTPLEWALVTASLLVVRERRSRQRLEELG